MFMDKWAKYIYSVHYVDNLQVRQVIVDMLSKTGT